MIKRNITIICALFLLGAIVLPAHAAGDRLFLFHLYSEPQTIVLDRNYPTPVEIIDSDVFSQEDAVERFEGDDVGFETNTAAPQYSIELVSFQGADVGSISFYPSLERVDRTITAEAFRQGSITLTMGYVPNAAGAIIKNSSGNQVLEIPLVNLATCNENAVCQADKGETVATCPSDCQSPQPATPAPNTSRTRNYIIIGLLGLALPIGVWLLIKFLKRMTSTTP